MTDKLMDKHDPQRQTDPVAFLEERGDLTQNTVGAIFTDLAHAGPDGLDHDALRRSGGTNNDRFYSHTLPFVRGEIDDRFPETVVEGGATVDADVALNRTNLERRTVKLIRDFGDEGVIPDKDGIRSGYDNREAIAEWVVGAYEHLTENKPVHPLELLYRRTQIGGRGLAPPRDIYYMANQTLSYIDLEKVTEFREFARDDPAEIHSDWLAARYRVLPSLQGYRESDTYRIVLAEYADDIGASEAGETESEAD